VAGIGRTCDEAVVANKIEVAVDGRALDVAVVGRVRGGAVLREVDGDTTVLVVEDEIVLEEVREGVILVDRVNGPVALEWASEVVKVVGAGDVEISDEVSGVSVCVLSGNCGTKTVTVVGLGFAVTSFQFNQHLPFLPSALYFQYFCRSHSSNPYICMISGLHSSHSTSFLIQYPLPAMIGTIGANGNNLT
jgi:hypothetical protein